MLRRIYRTKTGCKTETGIAQNPCRASFCRGLRNMQNTMSVGLTGIIEMLTFDSSNLRG